jgi:hypothetical protein
MKRNNLIIYVIIGLSVLALSAFFFWYFNRGDSSVNGSIDSEVSEDKSHDSQAGISSSEDSLDNDDNSVVDNESGDVNSEDVSASD